MARMMKVAPSWFKLELRMSVSDGTKNRRLLPSEVAAQIQAKIIDGSSAPGDCLPPERELASRLHVNRSSVREALKKLEELRLVDIQQVPHARA
jgi:DNA-binding FadR family transcriptional regulator